MSKKILEQRNVELELLKKYFSGRCTPEEEKQVESWFSDPSYEKVLKYKILEHWNEFDVSGEPDINGKKLLDRVYHQIYRSEWEYNRKSFLHKAYIKFAKAAAILLIPLLIFGAWYISKTVFTKDIGFAEIYSPMGARTHFRLPDGSQGWLNSGSTLRFPVKFVGRTRQVMLTGEGYFDVITLFQSGIKNVTASLGTALTPEQIYLLKRYSDNIYFAYDKDEAGKKATLRGLERMFEQNVNPKIIDLGDEKDPDDQQHGL